MAALQRALADSAAQAVALLATRLELFTLEAQEARDHLLGRLALVLLAVVCLLLALLVASLGVVLYFWPTDQRYLALGGLALLYAVLGLGFAWRVIWRARHDPAPFAVTLDVLRQDAGVLSSARTPAPASQAASGAAAPQGAFGAATAAAAASTSDPSVAPGTADYPPEPRA
ncbi:phage holin family protein [Castellaniella caeni]|uniref:phage holin family protein n=1 Tax=Castellaniella caeni TaxID=266123 RepID=UPI00082DE3EC|nr:phage holin family protein [Castellaniella caeni]